MSERKITYAILIIVILVVSILSIYISPLTSLSLKDFHLNQPANASIKIVGVTEEGEGVVSTLTVEIKPGNGRILMDTNVLTGFYTQYSLKKAVQVAENITKFSVDSENTEAIDGESAGAAIDGYEIPEDITITGIINEDGTIGHVGSLFEKAEAAVKSGINLFLLPDGQSNVVIYRPLYKIDFLVDSSL
ncbi:MAG: hypothetical protein EF806_00225 [Candidatus Methanoliparum thermophilum]|uniref:Lon proteolytic domain-containing protein n=1 Tax=Methanoliparum thermophilum TaxID=2491083 RepID=A0A520KU48_METT2|nr:hypothetical protein [Candidatus Methanoliparum sp. LAM-1]RZN65645.1 MAG: hypothetical protein EF806_00225 [Candidatus Methanoliparum thermophilum]BDC36530.1 hypothetical protein MTLP_12120 [Candidatus Methanoliparum sp. LAM-1]